MVADATLRATCGRWAKASTLRFTVESRRRARARRSRSATAGACRCAEGEPAEATFTLEVNEWNGVSEPRLVLRHARPRASVAEGRAEPAERARAGERRRRARSEELVLFALS